MLSESLNEKEAPSVGRPAVAVSERRPADQCSRLVLDSLSYSYRIRRTQAEVLADFDLTVEGGEFMTLLGPSGSGKTTALRLIAGFLWPDSGSISLGERDLTNVMPQQRDIGMVFQTHALFPHMSVAQNIAYGLKRRRIARPERRRRVDEMLSVIQLEGFADREISQLSGGQRQRVALARALAIEPSLLLFDEPLSSLDANLRGWLRTEIRRIQRATGVTAVYVTHDQEEALTMSDRVAVMNGGRIEQVDSPQTIYESPTSLFVAKFVGDISVIRAALGGRSDQCTILKAVGGAEVQVPDGRAHVSGHTGDVALAVRPEDMSLQTPGTPGAFAGAVSSVSYLGSTQLCEVTLVDGTRVRVTDHARTGAVGDRVAVAVRAERSLAYPHPPTK